MLKSVVEFSSDWLMWLVDYKNIKYISPAVEHITGYPPAAFMADKQLIIQVIHPADRSRITQAFIDETHDPEVHNVEFRIIHKDGTIRWIAHRCHPVFDDQHKIIGRVSSNRNITDKKRLELALFEKESFLKSIFDGIQDPMHVIDKEYRVLVTNKKLLEMRQVTQESIRGRYCYEAYQGRSEHCEQCGAKEVFRTGKPHSIKKILPLPDGSQHYFEVYSFPLFEENGDVSQVIEMTHDITSEEQAKQNMLKIIRIIEQSTESVTIMGLDFSVEYANPAFEKMTGYSVAEINMRNQQRMHSGKKIPEYYAKVLVAMTKGEVWYGQNKITTKQGKACFMDSVVFPIKDDNNVIINYAKISKDITQAKQVEAALKESEQKLRSYVESAPIGIFIADERGNYIDVNPAAEKITGYSRVELLQMNLIDLIPQDHHQRVKEHFDRIVKTGKTSSSMPFVTKDGSQRHWLVNVVKLKDDKYLAFHLDITERKQSEQKELEFEKQLLQTQKLESLGVLAGGIAHDFNNILMGILGYADLALSTMSPFAPEKEFIQGINDSTRKAAELVKQMLAYSGKGKFSLEPIDLNHLIEDTIQMLNISISKNAVLKFNYSKDPVFLEGDPAQIRQIIMNLVINASDAVGKKSGVIALSTGTMYCDSEYIETTALESQIIQTKALSEGMYIYVEVSDTGMGMSKKTMTKIFEPFFTTKYTGRGLGLSAVLGIVRGHHGLVKIYSEEGKGTTFKVLFPLLPGAETDKTRTELDIADDNWKREGTFLIADDEEAVRNVGKHMIKKLGYEVLTAADGDEAVKIFKEHIQDIVGVLLDLTMPHKDGAEVFREIRKLNPDVKVILSSGYNEQDATQQFIGKGLAGFIQKPYVSADLIQKIKEVFS